MTDKVRQFIQLERSYNSVIGNPEHHDTFFENLARASKLQAEIRAELADSPAVTVYDAAVRRSLRAIIANDTATTKLIDFLVNNVMTADPALRWPEEPFDPEEWDEWTEHLFDWIDAVGFKTRSEEIGTLIVGQHVPASINRQLEHLKRCYRLGLDTVSIVFCRALLEAAMVAALRRRPQGAVVDIDTWRFDELLRRIDRTVLSPRLKDRAHQIKQEASQILHSKADVEKKLSASALKTIRGTYEIISELFELGRRR